MKTAEFDYELPPELIAQTPLEPRDGSRLMVVDRRSGEIAHRRFYARPHSLRPGNLLSTTRAGSFQPGSSPGSGS